LLSCAAVHVSVSEVAAIAEAVSVLDFFHFGGL